MSEFTNRLIKNIIIDTIIITTIYDFINNDDKYKIVFCGVIATYLVKKYI
jgi:hypothetical protein